MKSSRSTSFFSRPSRRVRAFTLLEVMTVMTLIAAMTAIGASYIRRPSEGPGLNLSLSTTSSLFQSARSLALTMNTSTKILVHDDPSDPERYGRTFLLIFRDLDANGVPAWKIQGKPTTLPEGIYFDKEKSTMTASDPSGPTTAPVAMIFNYPGDLSESSGPAWLAYEFASNGTCAQAGEPFYLTSARRDPSKSNGLAFSDKNFSGFVLRRMGNATYLPPSQTLAN